jgi:hypothetical protein
MSDTDDTELDRYLAGDSPLSRAYRAHRNAEPPASADEFVLHAARRAHRRRPPRWVTPVAAAAVIALGLTTTLSLLRDEAIVTMGDDFEAAPSAVESADVATPAAPPRRESLEQSPAFARPPAPEAGSSPKARSAAPAVAGAPSAAQKTQADTAASWIKRIRDLRQAGLEDAARREFLAFRRLYPERPLPADLQDLESGAR